MTQHHNGNAKLNPQLVREMLKLRAEGWSYPRLARQFGVSENTVAKTCRGTAWRSVTGGQETLTDGEAQLRQLTTPQISQEAVEASLARFQGLLEAESNKSTAELPQQYQRAATQESYEQNLLELVKMAERRRAENENNGAEPPPAVRVRHIEEMGIEPTATAAAVAQVNAEKLLETLKDEHTNTSTTVSPSTTPV